MARKRRFVVALQEVEQGYGGPEEGGWHYHYDFGSPYEETWAKKLTRVFKSEAKAYRYCSKLHALIETMRINRKFCYDSPRILPRVQKGTNPRPFSDYRPWE
jgi:hypothetical protein